MKGVVNWVHKGHHWYSEARRVSEGERIEREGGLKSGVVGEQWRAASAVAERCPEGQCHQVGRRPLLRQDCVEPGVNEDVGQSGGYGFAGVCKEDGNGAIAARSRALRWRNTMSVGRDTTSRQLRRQRDAVNPFSPCGAEWRHLQ